MSFWIKKIKDIAFFNLMSQKKLRVIEKKTHGICHSDFPKSVLNVLNTLSKNGYDAYVVGGAIRDLLRGGKPKDFDIVTNAKPDEIKYIFGRKCIIIGKRFRLAHIYFGREYLEVATFRANEKGKTDNKGRVIHHNEYGSIEDDVFRRDFSINALYYNVKDSCLYDYVDAFRDIKNGIIKVIGNAEERYEEDPVRILRAIRFATKLSLDIDKETKKAISNKKALIYNVPSARLYTEIEKFLYGGQSRLMVDALLEHNILQVFFPEPNDYLKGNEPYFKEILYKALKNTDTRIKEGRRVSKAFLLAVFYWPIYENELKSLETKNVHWHKAMHLAADDTLKKITKQLSPPAYCKSMVRDIFTLQKNLWYRPKESQIKNILSHKRFRAAYDFLEICYKAGRIDLENPFLFWTEAQEKGAEYNLEMLPLRTNTKKKRRYKKPKKIN